MALSIDCLHATNSADKCGGDPFVSILEFLETTTARLFHPFQEVHPPKYLFLFSLTHEIEVLAIIQRGLSSDYTFLLTKVPCGESSSIL